jgi:hypothetical protein
MLEAEDVAYLELDGVAAEVTMLGNLERGPGTVLLRLPVATAKQLGLVPPGWKKSGWEKGQVMREYEDRLVQEVAACKCDRCGRRMTPDDDPWEWYEKASLDWRGGFGSCFGDGAQVSVDLCQQCVRDTLGPWLRVVQPSAADDLGASNGADPQPYAPATVEHVNPLMVGEPDGRPGPPPLAIRLVKIVEQATNVFGDEDKAIRWLVTPNRQFGGRTALDMAKTDHDAQLAAEALVRIDEGYL